MTENNRLQQIDTTMYQDASTTTLEDFIWHARRDFESRIISFYQMAKPDPDSKRSADVTPEWENACDMLKKSIYTTAFYDLFKHFGVLAKETAMFPIYHFRVNPKNINFETTFTNLREMFNGMIIYPNDDRPICENPRAIRYIKDIPDWEDLFGKGEFPNMTIYVFRLGNTEYFAYTIGR